MGFWLIEYREKSWLRAPCPWECTIGVRELGRSTAAGGPQQRCTVELPDIQWSSRTTAMHSWKLAVEGHLSLFNRCARGSAPPESVSSAGARPSGDRDRGDRLPCTSPGSSAPAAVVPRGGSSFCIQSPCQSRVNVEIVVMSDPTICSPTLVFWSRDTTLRLVIATNSTGTNSILSSRGPSQAKVGEAMNTNSPTDVSW